MIGTCLDGYHPNAGIGTFTENIQIVEYFVDLEMDLRLEFDGNILTV